MNKKKAEITNISVAILFLIILLAIGFYFLGTRLSGFTGSILP